VPGSGTADTGSPLLAGQRVDRQRALADLIEMRCFAA
jgi:hypothetical protein